MKNSKNRKFTCKGINNALAILGSNRFNIIRIDVLIDGRADGHPRLKNLIDNSLVSQLRKDQFYKKHSGGRTQGIIVEFSGKLIESRLPDFKNKSNVCLLALDQIEDPQNFGQIIRTAECAGIEGIIYSKHHSVPLTDTALQVSQGAFVNMKFYEVTNIKNELKKLKKYDFWIIGFENSINAKPWYSIDYSGKTAIVVGSEGRGIRKKVLESCDFVATVPMQGLTNSLNVSAATSAIVFERLRQKLEKK